MLRPGTLKSMLDNDEVIDVSAAHFHDVRTKCLDVIGHIDNFTKTINLNNPMNSMHSPQSAAKINKAVSNYAQIRDDTEKLSAWAESALDADRSNISAAELIKFYEIVVSNAAFSERLKNQDIGREISSITSKVIITIDVKEISDLYNSIRSDHLFVIINEHTEDINNPAEYSRGNYLVDLILANSTNI